jgi:GNAT superfamily N-acetyltransferase
VADINIRRALVSDANAIAALLEIAFSAFRDEYTPEAYDATVFDAPRIRTRLGEAPSWVALHGDDVVGTVTALPRADAVHMRALAVHPSARGQRLGERLVQTVVEWATAANASRLTLSTTPFLTASRRLYERCGFVVDDTQAGGDLHGTPLIALVRHLRDGGAE